MEVLIATAVYVNQTKATQFLLDNGADVSAKGNLFGNALQTAIARGRADFVELLLSHGAEIDPLRGQELKELEKQMEELS